MSADLVDRSFWKKFPEKDVAVSLQSDPQSHKVLLRAGMRRVCEVIGSHNPFASFGIHPMVARRLWPCKRMSSLYAQAVAASPVTSFLTMPSFGQGNSLMCHLQEHEWHLHCSKCGAAKD